MFRVTPGDTDSIEGLYNSLRTTSSRAVFEMKQSTRRRIYEIIVELSAIERVHYIEAHGLPAIQSDEKEKARKDVDKNLRTRGIASL